MLARLNKYICYTLIKCKTTTTGKTARQYVLQHQQPYKSGIETILKQTYNLLINVAFLFVM